MSTSPTTRPTKRKAPTGKSGPAPSKGSDLTGGNDTANKAAVKPTAAPFNPQISLCSDAKATATQTASLRDVLAEIKDGTHQKQVEFVRKTLAEEGKDAANELKRQLPAVLFSGEFSKRNALSLVQHSGILCVDIDAADNEAVLQRAGTRSLIEKDQHTLAVFTSPSGTGLKVLVRCSSSRPHLEAFNAARRYFAEEFGLAIDDDCKDVSRLCFVSYDPDLFARDNCPELPCKPEDAVQVSQPLQVGTVQAAGAVGTVQAMPSHFGSMTKDEVRGHLAAIPPRPAYLDWLRIASAVWSVLLYKDGCEVLEEWSPEEKPGEYLAKYGKRLTAIGAGTLVHYARQGGGGGSLQTATPASATDLRSRLRACRFDAATQPPKPSPRFFLNNTGICTTGNLTTIAAQAKAGKSALIGAAIAAAICAENQTQGCDTLGLTATPPKGRRLLHFDTEQSPYDADRLVRRSLQRAGAQAGVAFLDSYRVAGLTPPNLRSALKMLMTELSSVHGVFGVIIDGVADFVSDVNNAVECNAFIAELHQLAIDYDCPIICILHENPTQDSGKMRGHLGSQLERKAESNLRLKRTEDVTTVFGEKMRGAPILEKDGPAFRWSVIVDMHMSTVNAGQVAMVKKQAKYADLAEDVWQSINNPITARRCDVIKAIMAVRNIMNSTAEDRFDDLRNLRIIIKDLKTGLWSLNPI